MSVAGGDGPDVPAVEIRVPDGRLQERLDRLARRADALEQQLRALADAPGGG